MTKSKNLALGIAALHVMCSFFWQRYFFPEIPSAMNLISTDPIRAQFLICSRVLSILITIFMWKFLFFLLSKEIDRHFRNFFFIFFIPALVVTILIYPSMYGWEVDCLQIYRYALSGKGFYYINYFAGAIYLGTYFSFIHPISLPILQSCLEIIVIAKIISQFYTLTSNKWIRASLFLVFFLEDSYRIFLQPYRNNAYTILSLALFSQFLFSHMKKEVLSWKSTIIVAIISGILAFWRSEGILYLFLSPLILLSIYRRTQIKKCIAMFLVMLLTFSVLAIPQNVGIKKEYGLGYIIVSLVSWVHDATQYGQFDSQYEGYYKDIQNINKVVDISYIRMLPGPGAFFVYTSLYGYGLDRTSASMDEQKQFISASINVVLHNKLNFLIGRTKSFLQALNVLQILQKLKLLFHYNGNLRAARAAIAWQAEKQQYPYYIEHALDGYFVDTLPKIREQLSHTTFWNTELQECILKFLHYPWRLYHLSSTLLATLGRVIFLGLHLLILFIYFHRKQFVYFACVLSNLIMLIAIIIFSPEGRLVYYYPQSYVAFLLVLFYFVLKSSSANSSSAQKIDVS